MGPVARQAGSICADPRRKPPGTRVQFALQSFSMNQTEGTPGQCLDSLIGAELSSIEFVRDYIQFRFDGPCLTAISDPSIMWDGARLRRTDAGFCDTLLRFIGLAVNSTSVIPGKVLRIHFPGERSIDISLRLDSCAAVEAVTFNDSHGGLYVW